MEVEMDEIYMAVETRWANERCTTVCVCLCVRVSVSWSIGFGSFDVTLCETAHTENKWG